MITTIYQFLQLERCAVKPFPAHRLFLVVLLISLSKMAMSAGSSLPISFHQTFTLQTDGRSYLLQQRVRSAEPELYFELGNSETVKQLLLIESDDGIWYKPNPGKWTFPSGEYSLIYKGKFDSQVTENDEGHFIFESNRSNQGYYHKRGFKKFAITWILPESMEIVSYSSNIGTAEWIQSGHLLHFRTSQQNNIKLQIQYRQSSTNSTIDNSGTQKTKPLTPTNNSANQEIDTSTTETIINRKVVAIEPIKTHETIAIATNTITGSDCESLADFDLANQFLCSTDQRIILKNIYFTKDSATLSPVSRGILDSLADGLKEYKTEKIEIAAYTDARGTKSWNKQLSKMRAETIREYLIYRQIAPERMVAKGYGEKHPIASNISRAGRKQNRRIELHLIKRNE